MKNQGAIKLDLLSHPAESAQSFDQSVHDVDVTGLRLFRKTRHPHNFAHDHYDHLRAVVDDDVADFQFEIFRYAVRFRVGREGVLGFGDADGVVGEPSFSISLSFFSACVV